MNINNTKKEDKTNHYRLYHQDKNNLKKDIEALKLKILHERRNK